MFTFKGTFKAQKERKYYRRILCRYDIRGRGQYKQKAQIVLVPTTALNIEDYCVRQIQQELLPHEFIDYCQINRKPIIKTVNVDKLLIQ